MNVEVAAVRAHVVELLAGGMTRSALALAAGVDATTVTRLLRPDVRQVRTATAEAVLAVKI